MAHVLPGVDAENSGTGVGNDNHVAALTLHVLANLVIDVKVSGKKKELTRQETGDCRAVGNSCTSILCRGEG